MKFDEFYKFMSYLKTIIDRQKLLEQGIKAFLCTGYDLTTDTYQAQDYYIKLLEHIFDDYNGWISHYVYELDFGTKELAVVYNNEPYELNSIESLYNLLILEKEKNNE